MSIIVIGILFIFTVVWFSSIHPVYITDADDWTHISYTRSPFPDTSEWNATRVFPEVLMPWVAQVSIAIIEPICGDFVFAITLGTSILIAFFLCIFHWQLIKLLQADGCSRRHAVETVLFLFLSLFMVLRKEDVNNTYLLTSIDLTCCYYYVIPNLLAISLSLYYLRNRFVNIDGLSGGGKILAIYLCLVSNLFSSILFISVVFSVCAYSLIFLRQENVYLWAKKQTVELSILFSYLVIMFIEVCGGRAQSLMDSGNSIEMLRETIDHFVYLFFVVKPNKMYILLSVGISALSLIYARKYNKIKCLRYLLISSFFTFVAIVVLCSKTFPYYITRGEILFVWLITPLIIVALLLGRLLKKVSTAEIAIPFILFIMLVNTNTRDRTFKDITYYENAWQYDHQILNCAYNASKRGDDSLTYYVPYMPGAKYNFPYAVYLGPRFSRSFYNLGVTDKPLKIGVKAVRGKTSVTDFLTPEERDSVIYVDSGGK